jgi:hypothetical protein
MNSEVDYYAQLREHAGRIWKWGFIGRFGGAREGDDLERHSFGYGDGDEMQMYGSDRDILAEPYACEDYYDAEGRADSNCESTAPTYPMTPNLARIGRP